MQDVRQVNELLSEKHFPNPFREDEYEDFKQFVIELGNNSNIECVDIAMKLSIFLQIKEKTAIICRLDQSRLREVICDQVDHIEAIVNYTEYKKSLSSLDSGMINASQNMSFYELGGSIFDPSFYFEELSEALGNFYKIASSELGNSTSVEPSDFLKYLYLLVLRRDAEDVFNGMKRGLYKFIYNQELRLEYACEIYKEQHEIVRARRIIETREFSSKNTRIRSDDDIIKKICNKMSINEANYIINMDSISKVECRRILRYLENEVSYLYMRNSIYWDSIEKNTSRITNENLQYFDIFRFNLAFELIISTIINKSNHTKHLIIKKSSILQFIRNCLDCDKNYTHQILNIQTISPSHKNNRKIWHTPYLLFDSDLVFSPSIIRYRDPIYDYEEWIRSRDEWSQSNMGKKYEEVIKDLVITDIPNWQSSFKINKHERNAPDFDGIGRLDDTLIILEAKFSRRSSIFNSSALKNMFDYQLETAKKQLNKLERYVEQNADAFKNLFGDFKYILKIASSNIPSISGYIDGDNIHYVDYNTLRNYFTKEKQGLNRYDAQTRTKESFSEFRFRKRIVDIESFRKFVSSPYNVESIRQNMADYEHRFGIGDKFIIIPKKLYIQPNIYENQEMLKKKYHIYDDKM